MNGKNTLSILHDALIGIYRSSLGSSLWLIDILIITSYIQRFVVLAITLLNGLIFFLDRL